VFKLFKWIAGILFTILLLLGVAVIAATHFLNPNDFKPILAKSLSAKIGHTIDIKGELKLTVFPNIAFSAEQVEIKNRPNFTRPLLAEVQSTALNVQFKPLLKRQVKVDALHVKGIKLYLEQNAAGVANWVSNEKPNANNATASSATAKRDDFELSIAKLSVENAQIEYIDQPNKQQYQVKDAKFKTENIAPNATAFPVDLAFKLIQQQNKKVTLNTDAKLSGKLNFSNLSQILLKEANATLTIKQAKGNPITAKLAGDLSANILTNTYALNNLLLKVDDSTAKGKLTVQLANRIKFNFDLHIDQLNLDKYQSQTAYQYSLINTAYAAPKSTVLSHGLAEQYDLSGQLNIAALKVANLSLSDVKMTASTVERKGFNFSPITAKLYSGQFNGQVFVDLKTNEPFFQFLGQATKVNLAPFLDDLTGSHTLSGQSQVTFDLRSAGLDKNRFIRSLNGNAKVVIKSGQIEGVDIPYYYQTAQALLKKQTTSDAHNMHLTKFESLSATIFSHNGVLVNDDLLLTAAPFKVTGKGKIFLAEETLDYAVVAKKVNEQGDAKDGHIPAALKIKGSFTDPKVTPDIEAMAKPAIEHELKKQLDKQLNKIFKQDGRTPPANNEPGAEQPKKLDEKINREIDKGLKKLFKF
jgi:AsmA protein